MFVCCAQEQYEFIHDALCGFAMSGNTYINATEFDQELARLKEISEDGGYTAVEKQFQVSSLMWMCKMCFRDTMYVVLKKATSSHDSIVYSTVTVGLLFTVCL